MKIKYTLFLGDEVQDRVVNYSVDDIEDREEIIVLSINNRPVKFINKNFLVDMSVEYEEGELEWMD